ncbi:3-oxoacyl-[acyl-carrier protein] reductase [Modestobacter sp. DSM 44400]|uniref:SDR family NAD(P)-dependent oxidoreductase n=1 Tax=Modestobacter sp. DSM 44400 TaxID=1550230 RepID=UPI00089997DF|nr:SDR family NAD(P)-dependent oxidoreductase [Modestobacter sp. DSM 44400]SDY12969.1 3-oxoacyl-[acyl-carrier protein] reductase [Modestobacter sp. DSM 44400]
MAELDGRLDGAVAVVTGTAQGIGQAIARTLADAGATVHEVDKDDVDLSVSAAVEEFFAGIGDVDVLVNNAGGVTGQTHTPIDELTDAAWDAVVDANLRTTLNCTRAAARSMKRRRYGRIVTISSGAGRSVSLTGIQAYASAKAAQIGFTRQMAHELGPFGITVNCIAPGFVLSNPTTQRQWESYGADGQQALLERIAVRATGKPADIARGVLFFAVPSAGWVSGQTLSIDGGHSLF